jgi:hypothetical protein
MKLPFRMHPSLPACPSLFFMSFFSSSHYKGKDTGKLLREAAKEGHPVVIRYLLEQGVEKNAVDDGGRTAFYEGCKAGQLDAVRVLFQAGADMDMAMNYGTTPLMVAGESGHLEVTRFLLEKGADTAKMDQDGNAAIDRSKLKPFADDKTKSKNQQEIVALIEVLGLLPPLSSTICIAKSPSSLLPLPYVPFLSAHIFTFIHIRGRKGTLGRGGGGGGGA